MAVTTHSRPSDAALAAFGINADPAAAPTAIEPLPGGRGLTWRAGPLVLRPSGEDDETVWKANTLTALPHERGFRTPRPIPSTTGAWAVDGWEAWQWLPGRPDESRVGDVIRAGQAFHRAVAGLPRPDFLDAASDPWAQADRMVWEEALPPTSDALGRLCGEFRRVAAPSQLVHGDLLGNVMFDDAAAPTIIDWAPYWRPVGYAEAIVFVDAVCWHDYPSDRMREWAATTPEGRQMVLRALAFRIATLHVLGAWGDEMAEHHAPVIEAALA